MKFFHFLISLLVLAATLVIADETTAALAECISDFTFTTDSCGASCTAAELVNAMSASISTSEINSDEICEMDSYSDLIDLGDCASCTNIVDYLECTFEAIQDFYDCNNGGSSTLMSVVSVLISAFTALWFL
mmetsp:Transcript_27561/g.35590  ORF Transcript_27561/g.35590 Transcript_27561/m.35590 type:complete len:132 (-) Transcript_27561:610-1005(-)